MLSYLTVFIFLYALRCFIFFLSQMSSIGGKEEALIDFFVLPLRELLGLISGF